MTTGFEDLTSHSATLEEVRELASWVARVVVVVRESGALLPRELSVLAGEAEGRASVQRRLAEMTKAVNAA